MNSGSSASRPSSPSSRQSKVMMQRHYREKEGECFVILRDVIKELTGDELQTRQEILKKAIELLLSLSEARRQRTTEIVPPVATDEDPPPPDPAEMALLSTHLCYSLTSSPPFHVLHTTQSDDEFNLQNAYVPTQPHDQRYHSILMSNMDLAVDPNSYQEYRGDGLFYPDFIVSGR